MQIFYFLDVYFGLKGDVLLRNWSLIWIFYFQSDLNHAFIMVVSSNYIVPYCYIFKQDDSFLHVPIDTGLGMGVLRSLER